MDEKTLYGQALDLCRQLIELGQELIACVERDDFERCASIEREIARLGPEFSQACERARQATRQRELTSQMPTQFDCFVGEEG